MLQDQNVVSFLHRGKSVRNHQGGSTAHGRLQSGLNHALTVCIQGAGGFVQQQERWIFEHGARNGNALTLAA